MTKRKTISKKLRFELFKRDNFTCQYCGSTPPGVVLEIDHINPVSSGGNNSEENLITSCFDCNRGKSSNLLTDIPKSLKLKSEEAKEKELQIEGYNKILTKKADRINAETWNVVDALEYSKDVESYNRQRLSSIKKFLNKLPCVEVLDAAELTSCKFGAINDYAFRYFCGVCWGKIRGDYNG